MSKTRPCTSRVSPSSSLHTPLNVISVAVCLNALLVQPLSLRDLLSQLSIDSLSSLTSSGVRHIRVDIEFAPNDMPRSFIIASTRARCSGGICARRSLMFGMFMPLPPIWTSHRPGLRFRPCASTDDATMANAITATNAATFIERLRQNGTAAILRCLPDRRLDDVECTVEVLPGNDERRGKHEHVALPDLERQFPGEAVVEHLLGGIARRRAVRRMDELDREQKADAADIADQRQAAL